MMRFFAFPSLLLLVLAPASADDRLKETFQQTLPMASGGRLAVDSFNGSVEITGHDQNTIEVSGTRYADSRETLAALKVEVAPDGGVMRVRAVRPEGSRGNAGVQLTIKVPRRTELEQVHTSNGGIRISDLEGNAQLRTSNGAVRVARLNGTLDARSSNGAVEVQEIRGPVTVSSSNGSLTAEAVNGSFSGSTSNGSVKLALAVATEGVTVKTSNGSITLRMPGSAAVRVRAATSGHSRISSDFEVARSGPEAKGRLEGTIGAGGPLVDLTTSNGSIRLLRQ